MTAVPKVPLKDFISFCGLTLRFIHTIAVFQFRTAVCRIFCFKGMAVISVRKIIHGFGHI